MGGAPVLALLAAPADDIDLPHHALTDPRGILRLNDFPDELMPENARVGIITFDQFQVGAANPCLADLYQRFIRIARS